MNPRNCSIKHNPPYSHGDCMRACLATLLDRDDVPHFFDGRSFEMAWMDLRLWLSAQKKTIAFFPSPDHAETMSEVNSFVPYILMYSTGETDHAAIFRNGEKIHDPAWYTLATIKPHSIGFFIIIIITDLI